MKKLSFILSIIFFLIALTSGYAYSLVTVDMSTAIENNSFDDGLFLWRVITTLNQTTVNCTNYLGRSAVFLQANYTNSTCDYEAAISSDTIIASTATTWTHRAVNLLNTCRDAIIIKVYIMGMPSMSAYTVTGQFSVEVKGALSILDSSPSDTTGDNRTLQRCFLQSCSSDSVLGVMTSWNVLAFTFTPPPSDWWQIRQIKLCYKAAPNQVSPTGIMIDKVELYAIRVDNEF